MNDSNAASASNANQRLVRIIAGARLHFGLLNTCSPFGGLGVMVDAPSTEVVVTECSRFVCDPTQRSRIEPIAQRITQACDLGQLPRCRVEVIRRPESHCGLGSGTQLSLAVTEAISRFVDYTFTPDELAIQLAERGRRSTVGVHGYFCGGMIFERGRPSNRLNSIDRRIDIPSDWHVAIFRPRTIVGKVSGELEREKFARIGRSSSATASVLEEICKRRIIPAAEQLDFTEFARAVQEYNHASGMLFSSVQGGAYNGEAVAELVESLAELGATGIGQSSWGPGVFAWFETRGRADSIARQMPSNVELIAMARPLNTPRQIDICIQSGSF